MFDLLFKLPMKSKLVQSLSDSAVRKGYYVKGPLLTLGFPKLLLAPLSQVVPLVKVKASFSKLFRETSLFGL